jgi:hypothetical protein
MQKYLLLAMVLTIWGCDHNIVKIGEPIQRHKLLPLKETKSTYGDVLWQLGPPVKIAKYGEGFLFIYASFSTQEGKLTASYGQYGAKGKIDVALGNIRQQIIVFYFGQNGILKQVGSREGKMIQGWGFAIGPILLNIDIVENPFFDKYNYYEQQHLPIIVSLLDKEYSSRPPSAQNMKYMEGSQDNPRGSGDEVLIPENSPKRTRKKEHNRKPLIKIDQPAESSESSDLRWKEILEEKESRRLEYIVPHAPTGILEDP